VSDTATRPEEELVAWDVAERVARRSLQFVQPFDATVRRRLETDFAAATRRAEELVVEATGLVSAAGPARALVVDRASWVSANIGSFSRLLAPSTKRQLEDPSARARPTSTLSRGAAGAELGLLLAWVSGRVLGQYDLVPLGEGESGDVVYYVGPNIDGLERRNGFPPPEFRLWIALHELTHRMQFTGVPWLRPYFLDLVGRATDLSHTDGRALFEGITRAATALREGRNPLAEGGIAALFAGTELQTILHEAQALMSLLEGHAEYVMRRTGSDEIPGAARFARVLAERRAKSGGLARLVQQALGFEAKIRQYGDGRTFVEAIVAAGGDELFSRIWGARDMLPTIEEIRSPQIWIDRVDGGVTSGG
jgi:coenzyme F420 biosynthesis associated uncharacterized protein